MRFGELARTRVAEIDRREPVIVSALATLDETVDAMTEHRRGSVLVRGADGMLVGIFTESDLVRRVEHATHHWRAARVADFMTPSPESVGCDDPISAALRTMFVGGFRRVPVIDPDGAPIAMVSIRDILRFVAQHYPKRLVNLPPHPGLETRRPWGG